MKSYYIVISQFEVYNSFNVFNYMGSQSGENVRIFFELTDTTKKIKRLFDASALLSFSSLIIVENLIIFAVPITVL